MIFSKKKCLLLFLAGFIFLSITSIQNQIIPLAYADPYPDSIERPIDFTIRTTILDMGKIEFTTGHFEVTFWITIQTDDIDLTQYHAPIIDFVNGQINSVEFETVTEDTYYAKINGEFFTNMEFRDYPLTHLDLPIIMESAHHEIDDIVFHLAETSSSPIENFAVPGLILEYQEYNVINYQYPDGEVYSRFSANLGFNTPFVSTFMVGIFPIIIMAGVVVLSFFLNPLSIDIRGEISIGVLIAGIFFHILEVGDSLPPLEYMTLEDKLMTVLYALVITSLVALAIQRKFNKEEDDEKAERLNKKIRYALPIIIVGTFLAVWQL